MLLKMFYRYSYKVKILLFWVRKWKDLKNWFPKKLNDPSDLIDYYQNQLNEKKSPSGKNVEYNQSKFYELFTYWVGSKRNKRPA